MTSPFTLYWTIQKILSTFTSTKSPINALDSETDKKIRRKHKKSFFDFIPKEKCKDVGVPEAYCPCDPLKTLELDDPLLKEASILAITYINEKLIDKCVDLEVAKILAGGLKKLIEKWIYIVTFVTTPGHFEFEAEVNYFPGNTSFGENPPVVQRVNKINSNFITCLSDRSLDLYCYCR